MTTTHDLASTYFTSWQAEDFDTLRSILADNTQFDGPLGTAGNIDECVAGLRGVRGMVDDIAVTKIWADGDDAITWFELRRDGEDPVPTVNWSHVEGGKIARIRVLFDPRPLLPPQ